MAGFLGSDFDPAQPENSDSVKFGAEWIRDLKRRVKLFSSRLFNLETGALKDSVIRQASLTDSGVVAGTYNRVRVTSKGLVDYGELTSQQLSASYFQAMFLYGGSYFFETELGVVRGVGTVADSVFLANGSYTSGSGGSPYAPEAYAVNCNYTLYQFSPPAGVRRVKATIVGGGGAGSVGYGGGGGELVQTIIPLDGSGSQALTIVVGDAGSSGTAYGGGPSRVLLSSSIYADAGFGFSATASGGGASVAGGGTDTTLGILRSIGGAGAQNTFGRSGSMVYALGNGGFGGRAPQPGAVYLEWVK